MFTQCHIHYITSNVTLGFAPLATGPNFGSSDSIGSLKGQAEMTLKAMSSDPNNAVKQFRSDLMRLVMAMIFHCLDTYNAHYRIRIIYFKTIACSIEEQAGVNLT